MKNDKYLNELRHSAAHLLCAAVLELYPNAKPTIGPSIENGFYYDFDFGQQKVSDSDLKKIEKKMDQLVRSWSGFEKQEVTPKEALKKFADNPYKKELIEEFSGEDKQITFYKSGEFLDLCRGGHIENPAKELRHFKLMSVAGAYWRGDEKNTMLTRIYGTAWSTKEELEQYLWQLEEAKKRDHRKLGRELELFTVPEEVGPGLFIWLPNGATIIRELEKYEFELQEKLGYKHVKSPHIGKKDLWVKSGHWDLYRDKMYSPMQIDDVEYLVKPMSCPMHIMVYKSKGRSYRELPLKIGEVASVYRYEQSGELSGLARVRYFNQDDAHIFCRPDQVKAEIFEVLNLLEKLYDAFELKDLEFWLTTRSDEKKDKYLGSDKVWGLAEKALEEALVEKAKPFIVAPGEAKFYGPSIDVMVRDSLGRKWQCGTIQVDFSLPERFELEYTNEEGKPDRPVMVHRAPLGSLERFMSVAIEHLNGAFPVWCAPIQTTILPINDAVLEYAKQIEDKLKEAGVRVELDSRSETLQSKIRDAQLQKIPYMLIVGKREAENKTISVRLRTGEDLGGVSIDEFLGRITSSIEAKSGL